ncbi:hypothetical protein IV500_06070 [Paeniglutamicibacter antarcticus]|uniref:Uncharacterized protein n=1 Tax=Arthrobacter terrae TaxID=2935737 RepID=A0A931G776_9MICC|nr:hypothetical protein [Arthrobacter terrae]MBG0738989.1 hypothetical protein [Arthrobacter terrae]
MSPSGVIAQMIANVYSRRSGLPVGSFPAPMDRHVASSLIDSWVFLQAELKSPEELDALPIGSVVRAVITSGQTRSPRFFRRMPAGWFFLTTSGGDGWPYTSAEVLAKHSDGTATYVWNGDAQ